MAGVVDGAIGAAGGGPSAGGLDGAIAPLAEAASAAGRGLAAQLKQLVAAGGPDLNPATVASLQSAAAGSLVGTCGGLAPVVAAQGGAGAFAPSGRFLTQAIGRMADPEAPDPAEVACRLIGRQGAGAVNPGMLANGPGGMLPDAAQKLMSAIG